MLLLISLPCLFVGCGKTKPTPVTTNTKTKEAVDPWPRAVSALRKDADLVVCQRVLNELNAAIPATPADDHPQALLAEVVAEIRKLLNLGDDESKELQSVSFTPLDAHYLTECLYLRDIARTLDVASAPPAQRARIAFEWVCRHVVLAPWRLPMPPGETLRRGAGSGLDRAYVFAAIASQLDLEVYFVGQSGAIDWKATHIPAGQKDAKGPFWAVAVRDGDEFLLYDPWRGEPIPGANPDRPATLAEVRAKPETVAVWLDNKAVPWDVGKEDLRAGELYVALPMSASAGRLRLLESKLKTDTGVRLFTDLIARLESAKTAAKGVPVRVWSPARDPFCLTNILRAYLSPTEGGIGVEKVEAIQASQLPRASLFAPPAGMTNPEALNTLMAVVLSRYAESFMKLPTPRERIQRGNFITTAESLYTLRDEFTKRAAQLQVDEKKEQTLKEFVDRAEQFFGKTVLAMRADPAVNPPALVNAAVGGFFKDHLAGMEVALDGQQSKGMLAEATFLLAMGKHERAERIQRAYERTSRLADGKETASARLAANDEWSAALDLWQQYDRQAEVQKADFPGRAEHARRLTARATQMAAATR